MTDTTAPAPTTVLGLLSPTHATRRSGLATAVAFGKRHPVVLSLSVYLALALIAYLPVGPLDSRQLPLGGVNNPADADPSQMVWFLAWLPYALTHGLSLFHTNYLDYPGGVNLANNTSVPLLAILGWPVTATLGPVATFNLLIRLSFAVSAASMFFVLRRWCTSYMAPFLAGLLYAFGPFTAAQRLHLDLVFIPFPPLLVLLGDELLHRQRMRPIVLGVLIGLTSAGQYLVSQEVFSGCSVVAAIAVVGLGIKYRRQVRQRLPYVAAAMPFAAIVFGLFCGYSLYEAVRGPGHLRGPVISLNALQATRSDLLSPLVPTSNQLATNGFISHAGDEFVNGNISENGGYLGIPLLVLLAVIVRRLRRDATVRAFFWIAVSAFVLSLGSYLVIGTWRSPLPMPEYVFMHIPLLQSNVPARFSLFVLLFVALIVAIGVDRLWLARRSGTTTAPEEAPDRLDGQRLMPPSSHRRARLRLSSPTISSGLACALVVVSLLPAVPYASRGLLWPASLPSRLSQSVAPGSVVLSYPFTTPTPIHVQPMVWQATDHMEFRLMGGYADIQDPGYDVGRRWPDLLQPASVEELLGYQTVGDKFPNPPLPTPAIEDQLVGFLNRYHVRAVVDWTTARAVTDPVGPDRIDEFLSRAIAEGQTPIGQYYLGLVWPMVVYWYFRQALGEPQVAAKRYSIWLPASGHWPSR